MRRRAMVRLAFMMSQTCSSESPRLIVIEAPATVH